ncbi:hypothetical protein [Pseudomonas putida]|uniref:hypothetical protein n=1 Tax=Pseudomonas putida TaxID=303 RepID=UPI0023636E02|nr:hypothetical protein [Pseudomonas putida]MDD2144691.1 hypothetical protein [Pseudomonas putida]HDS1709063.1 hypothetical protein [Pseudomonas putida]
MKRKSQVVKIPRYTFEALAAYTALGEEIVGIMMLLLLRMDSDRRVMLDINLLPSYLTIRRDRVDNSVALVIKKGWVHSVDQQAMRDGFLIGTVPSVFLDSDFETLIAFFNPLLTNTCKQI